MLSVFLEILRVISTVGFLSHVKRFVSAREFYQLVVSVSQGLCVRVSYRWR